VQSETETRIARGNEKAKQSLDEVDVRRMAGHDECHHRDPGRNSIFQQQTALPLQAPLPTVLMALSFLFQVRTPIFTVERRAS
jgi:hypothetical protein